MNAFSDPNTVVSFVSNMKRADVRRAEDRVLIQNAANGFPPLTSEEAEENAVDVNVNWGTLARTLHRARRQYENAVTKPSIYFTVTLEDAPLEKGDEWGRTITKEINRIMKRSLSYLETLRSVFAGVVLHGPGARVWTDEDCWEPEYVPIEDVLLPTGTKLTMKGTHYFASRANYSYHELAALIVNDKRDPGWNIFAVKQLLDTIEPQNGGQQNQYNWTDSPEKMWEIVKQNKVYWDIDSVPQIWVWNFFHQDDEKDNKWFRKVVLDIPGAPTASVTTTDGGKESFLYESREAFAENLGEIIHFQFGDGSNKPPFLYHSVRSLGYMLYDVTEMTNRLQSQFVQHVFEQLQMLIRVQDPADRARANDILLLNKGVVPDGVSILGPNERYQVNSGLVETVQSNFRQFIAESAAAFTSDVNDGTQKEMTATETMARVNDVNSLISSMLVMAYNYERGAQIEICRRFCRTDSTDEDVKKFQSRVKKAGIPDEWMDSEKWNVMPEMVLGGGHKMLEMAQSRELMQLAPQLDPAAQQRVKRMHVAAITDNSDLANELVPDVKVKTTFSIHDAEIAFGAMMAGSPVQPAPGLNRTEQLSTVIQLLQLKVQSIEQSGNVGTKPDVVGLGLAVGYATDLVNQLAQDKSKEQEVKQAQAVLADVENKLKAFAQRQMEQEQKQAQQQQQDPVAAQKLQLDQQKAQFDMQMSVKKLELENQKLMAMIQANTQKVQSEIQSANMATHADIQRQDASTQAEIQREGMKTQAEIAMDGAKTISKIKNDTAKTDATVRLQATRKAATKKATSAI